VSRVRFFFLNLAFVFRSVYNIGTVTARINYVKCSNIYGKGMGPALAGRRQRAVVGWSWSGGRE
jgi:hypothetical protein